MKKFTLFILLILHVCCVWAQRNPHREILVFFAEGTAMETMTQNGKTVLQRAIKTENLKLNLARLGVNESSFEPANPRFVEADTLKVLAEGTRLSQLNMTKLFRVRIDDDETRKRLIKELNKLPEVLYAEQNGTVTPYLIPSDDRFDEQWGLRNTVFPGRDIHAEQAWDIFTGNQNNVIAIVDGGIDVNHEDLNAKIAGGDTGFGWNGHGIHVAGIAAAESNNEQGISGVDWNGQIHAQRIDNVQDDIDVYNAIVDAVNSSSNVHVLNHSWGLTFPDQSPGRNSITVRQAFAFAYKANRTSVVAMGNHQQSDPGVVAFPAGFDKVISVGASNIEDVVANFSARGNHIDVAAPGVNILSTFTGGGYGNNSGTSMATPHVSGIASLLKGFNANLRNDDIESIIRLSADDLNNPPIFNDGTALGFDQSSGAGRVNAERALNFLRAPFTLQHANTTGGTVNSSTGTYTQQFLTAPGLASGNYTVKRHEVRKAVTYPVPVCNLVGVWGRGVGSSGWSLANPNFGEGHVEVVPGSATNTGVTLRTYVYEVWTILGQYLGYFPTSPGSVQLNYSVLGQPNLAAVAGPINGPSLICSTGLYALQNPPQGASIVWSSSNPTGASIDPASGTATRMNNFNGQVTLTAAVNSGCGSVNVTRNINVGNYLPIGTSSVNSNCSGNSFNVLNTSLSGICTANTAVYFSYRITDPNYSNFVYTPVSVPSGASWSGGGGTLNVTVYTPPTSGSRTATIAMSATGPCGVYNVNFNSAAVNISSGWRFAMSPNPSDGQVTVSTDSESPLDKDSPNLIYAIKVIDPSGTRSESFEYERGITSVSISLKDYRPGLYILSVFDGKSWSNKQLIVPK